MVVGDQGLLDGCAGRPVVPDCGVECEQPLHDACPQPGGDAPSWRSRPSWFFSVQMIASTRCRSQFGNWRGCFSSLRAGRIRTRPRSGPAKDSPVSAPARPLSVTTAVPGAGRFADWSSRICRVAFCSPNSLGLARPNPVTVPSQVQISSSLAPQYQREWLGQYPYPAQPARSERFAVRTDWPHGTGVASISRTSSAVCGGHRRIFLALQPGDPHVSLPTLALESADVTGVAP